MYFTTNQGCPATAPQLSCKARSLIVRRLAEELNASLSASIDPGIIAERVASGGRAADLKDSNPPYSLKLVVTGSSNMNLIIPHMLAKGLRVSVLLAHMVSRI